MAWDAQAAPGWGETAKNDDPFPALLRYNTVMPAKLPTPVHHLLLALLLLLTLSACGGTGADTPFTTYIERLQRTLSASANNNTLPAAVPRLPRAGQLRLTTERDSLGALDFLDLRGCDLQVTIGKQNSSLGKLARDSQRLLLALEFLRLAPACVDMLTNEGNEELVRDLERAQVLKQRQLPALIFNATLGSAEFADLWRPGSLEHGYPDDTSSRVITALEQINASTTRWLQGDYQADNLAFELQLSEVSLGDGGTLWRALAHQAHWLERANSVLQAQATRGPLCAGRIRPAAADILPNVIRKFFIDGIQPRAAILGRRQHELMPPVLELEQQLADFLPADYRRWQARRDSDLQDFGQAPREHVIQLQSVLESCEGNP